MNYLDQNLQAQYAKNFCLPVKTSTPVKSRPAPKPQESARESLSFRSAPADQTKPDPVDMLAAELTNLSTYKDPEQVFRKSRELVKLISDQVKSERRNKLAPMRTGGGGSEMRLASARIWNHFPNPWGVFAYLAENYWAFQMSLDVFRREIRNDKFLPKYEEGTSKEDVVYFQRMAKRLKIRHNRTEAAIHLKTYGNCWFLPYTNKAGGLERLELLFPDRMFPLYDDQTDTIIGWEYVRGRKVDRYPVDRLLHLMLPSVKSDQLGSPPAASMVTLMEADMYGDMLNSMVRQRGGVLKAVIGLDAPEGNKLPRGSEEDEDYMDRVQSRIDTVFSGARSGQSIAVMENVRGVFPLSNIGEMENNFRESKDQTGKYVAFSIGCPSEKIGIPRAPNIQYVPGFTQNQLNLDFDKECNSLMELVDDFFNEEVFVKRCRITTVRIQASGRFGAATLAAAQTIESLSKSGFKPTHNECRTRLMGWEELPPDDPRANETIDTSLNRDPESTPNQQVPPPDDMDFAEDTPEDSPDRSSESDD